MSELNIKIVTPIKTFHVKFESPYEDVEFDPQILKQFVDDSFVIKDFIQDKRFNIKTIYITNEKNPIQEMLDLVVNKLIISSLNLGNKNIMLSIAFTYACLKFCDNLVTQNHGIPEITCDVISAILEDIILFDTYNNYKDYINKLISVVEYYVALRVLSNNFTLEIVDTCAYFEKYIKLLNIAKTAFLSPRYWSGKFAGHLILQIQKKSLQYFNNCSEDMKTFIKLSSNFDGNFDYEYKFLENEITEYAAKNLKINKVYLSKFKILDVESTNVTKNTQIIVSTIVPKKIPIGDL